uniref:Polypeptide N-acetylgalactosaminyltransferase n=1 Tax=Ditylenchus dipsaci TaxID=166011 RepID=A0A915CRV3_9BILA
MSKDNETLNKIRDDLYRQNGYDAYISDQIPLDRSVKDVRHKGCKNQKYIEKLPSVSVIFPFHDEHFSTLLRSAYSIINRSPPGVVKEVILVDDASTKSFLKEPLEEFWKNKKLDHIVKVVRTDKREGLIRARVIGARAATSEIIIFLKTNRFKLPHCCLSFCGCDDCDNYEYRPQDEGARGSFDWEFNYKRLPITDEDQRNPTRPFKSPVMAGGYFAISTKWFWELGGYDEGLDIWGGEQYELSFKVWQCHGQMVDAPCSRVGHIYRCKYVPFPTQVLVTLSQETTNEWLRFGWMTISSIYTKEGQLWPEQTQAILTNSLRFDNDLTANLLTEIAFDQDRFYPAIEPPDGANGELKNAAANKCVDTRRRAGHANEFWSDIRPKSRNMCFDVSRSDNKSPVTLFACHGMKGNQYFKYRLATHQIWHKVSNLCMDCDVESGEIYMMPCDEKSQTQKWEWNTWMPRSLKNGRKEGTEICLITQTRHLAFSTSYFITNAF